MKTYSKSELEQLIGKRSKWNPKQAVNLFHYVAGIEGFDNAIGKVNMFSAINIADFEIHAEGLQIRMMNNFKTYRTGIKNTNIISITLEDSQQIYERKEKSVAGRAVLGGLLFGPFGAVVGGMTGLKDGQKKVKMPDLMLSIELGKDDDVERVLLFSTKFKDKKKAQDFFNKYYPEKFKIAD